MPQLISGINIEWVAHSHLQGIFPTQGLNLDLLHFRQILYCLRHLGNPLFFISSLAQLYPTGCDPMDCSMPGFPVHHQLLEPAQTCLSSQWFHPTISSSVDPFSSCLLSFPASGSFLMSQFFTSGGQSTGASASASILPMNIQDWFPLGLTGLISLQTPLDSQESSPTPQFKSINSLVLSCLYDLTLTFIHDYWKNHSFD